jgi:hypothetical protein
MWKSRTLCLASLALGLFGGCVIDETDDSAFEFQWQLEYVGGGTAACENSGTPSVRMQTRHTQTANAQTFTWDCSAGAGVTPVLPLGLYDVNIALLDRQGRPVSAIEGQFEVRRHGLANLGRILFKVQIFEFSWTIVREPPGASAMALNCGQAGAHSVEMVTQLASEPQESFTFTCEQGEGVTEAIRLGTYTFQGRLLNRAGQVLDETGVGDVRAGVEVRPQLAARFIVP